MDLRIKDQLFVVTGASSGLGRAVAECLLENGGQILAVARRQEALIELEKAYPGSVEYHTADLTDGDAVPELVRRVGDRKLHGIFVNAGGPPAMSFEETAMENWDSAYRLLLRWKVDLVKRLIPKFKSQSYGRILFSESSTVKQPIENLVLSNSLRMAVAGAAKTLALEVAGYGITVNLIGPGYHDTSAVDRLFKKKSELEGVSMEEARRNTLSGIPAGKIGDPADFATLASWLLSPLSGFVTGQVYSLDGGTTRYSLG